jgi:outer membrane protein OmpA-like peptidoglycan-associated protein
MASRGQHNVPENAVGPPVRNPSWWGWGPSDKYILGCGGSMVWKFADNLVVDVPGPDIFVFEGGLVSEPTKVELSKDGNSWTYVGDTEGGHSSVDIAKFVKGNETFSFIRLTDLRSSCWNTAPGADIDAIATYGYSWMQSIDDSSDVMFEFGKSEISLAAAAALSKIVDRFKSSEGNHLRIIGHTDNLGSEDFNAALSFDRASAVAKHVVKSGHLNPLSVSATGMGMAAPVESNDTEPGRARNRRVELINIPEAPCQ